MIIICMIDMQEGKDEGRKKYDDDMMLRMSEQGSSLVMRKT